MYADHEFICLVSMHAGKFCYETGLRLRKLEIVLDDNESIVESVRELSRRYDYVFTSGGIGSTHDDITYRCGYMDSSSGGQATNL
jgi:molybdopterin-biosynthesis enzyme MoeA-like protein